MNLSLSIYKKGFVSSPLTSDIMIKIIIITIYFATFFSFSSFFFAPNIGAKAYAQEASNSNNINTVSTKLATQGAYTALSVFFLGIGLVVFGLRLTSKVAPRIGRSMTIMVWALTIPVIILVGLYQYGVITGTSLISAGEEPFFLLSFLLYIPIAIVIFLLLEEKGIKQEQSAHISGPILEMEKLVMIKERGMITEEFQKLKAELMAKL